jgi:SAM-dependent methyltransferase
MPNYIQIVIIFLLTIRTVVMFSLSPLYGAKYPSSYLVTRKVHVSIAVNMATKGFGSSGGGGGFGSKSPTAPKRPTKEAIAKNIQKKYGGTTSSEIVAGTQKRVEESMKNLPTHLQIATKLYQQLQRWNSRLENMSILQQSNIPQSDIDGAKRAQFEFDRICEEHNVTVTDLHNIFQRITWDASADAKAARSLTGAMSPEIAQRVNTACRIIGEALKESDHPKPRCLDVGCGFGVLVPHLIEAGGVIRNQIYGVDLSSEMIRNARELNHRDIQFTAADFLEEYCGPNDDDGMFNGIIFCSSLHDLPDPIKALKKAESLLRPCGKIVIVHPQGAGHVNKQVESNPVLVQRGLPDSNELRCVGEEIGLVLTLAPAKANTPEDLSNGYLAVLQKAKKLESTV